MKIQEVIDALTQFAKKNLGDDPKVVNIRQGPEGWIGNVEVFDENAFIKSLGIATQQKEKKRYEINLDEQLDITSFSLLEEEQ
jgi:hypothetical protein